jgi:hypothetical protein
VFAGDPCGDEATVATLPVPGSIANVVPAFVVSFQVVPTSRSKSRTHWTWLTDSVRPSLDVTSLSSGMGSMSPADTATELLWRRRWLCNSLLLE